MNQAAQKYWNEFLDENPAIPKDTPYQVWFFGNTREMARELGELVISGKKFATGSLAETNRLVPDEAPIPNGFSVVTDFDGNPMCVVQTIEIRHMPFSEVDAQFAFDEGEGDQTLESWRQAHRDYFMREAAKLNFNFDEFSIVCCERFKLVFAK